MLECWNGIAAISVLFILTAPLHTPVLADPRHSPLRHRVGKRAVSSPRWKAHGQLQKSPGLAENNKYNNASQHIIQHIKSKTEEVTTKQNPGSAGQLLLLVVVVVVVLLLIIMIILIIMMIIQLHILILIIIIITIIILTLILTLIVIAILRFGVGRAPTSTRSTRPDGPAPLSLFLLLLLLLL